MYEPMVWAFPFYASRLKTNLRKLNNIENLAALHRILNLGSGCFRYLGIQDSKLACVYAQLNRWVIGLLYFAGLNRCLNFMIVTKGGKEAALVDPYRYRGVRAINFLRVRTGCGERRYPEPSNREREQGTSNSVYHFAPPENAG